jgi:hypothetical protein
MGLPITRLPALPLPDDVLLHVITFLDTQDVLVLRLVSMAVKSMLMASTYINVRLANDSQRSHGYAGSGLTPYNGTFLVPASLFPLLSQTSIQQLLVH